MGKRATVQSLPRSNGVPSRPSASRGRREVPSVTGSSLHSFRPLAQLRVATVFSSRVGWDPGRSGEAAKRTRRSGGSRRPERKPSSGAIGDEDDASSIKGGREDEMDRFYVNYLQDDSTQLPWPSSSPHAVTHTLQDPHVNPPEVDTHALGGGMCPTPPTFIPGIGHSSDGRPTRSSQNNKGKKPSSKSDRTKWTAEEDELLVSAWLNVSQDPIVGKDQSSDSYWSRIAEYFNTNKKDHVKARSIKGMVNHWASINECVSKYVGFLAQTDGLHASGTTERERMAHASRMYQDIEGKPFAFHHCWVMLANHPKWGAHMGAKRQKAVREAPNDSPVDLASQATSEYSARPTGREAAKAARKRACATGASDSTSSVGLYTEQFEKLNRSKDVMVELKREQVAMMREAEDERIMKIDLNSYTGMLREFYQKRQEDVMRRWMSRSSSG